MHARLTGILMIFAAAATAVAAEPQKPHWIWFDGQSSQTGTFQHTFHLTAVPREAQLRGVTDFADIALAINGQRILEAEGYDGMFTREVAARLKPGDNRIEVQVTTSHGPAAVFIELTLTLADGTQQTIASGPHWQAAATGGKARPAVSLGEVARYPWGRAEKAAVSKVDDYNQWKQAIDAKAGTDPKSFYVLDNFEVDLVRSAAEDEGSWISMAFDPKGRLLVGREDQGILRFTLPSDPQGKVQVETVNKTLKECRGLVWAHRSLYAHANESKGLFRLRDTNGDDQFDEEEQLLNLPGGSGHGRNQICLGPDGWIYGICGDSVDLPNGMFDRTSPVREARRGAKTREGFVYRMRGDGERFELLVAGLRNPFGIDISPAGEMFTYDADAEYDTGAPWYRPTRVHNLVRGADYGWRGVTRSWPPYYVDHPTHAPPNIDIGQGSPTAVKFGTQSNFPPPYRDALFALDWAYGRVLAVHLTSKGASYTGRAETFLKGRPLNVCDLDFGPDGAMYLVTGGRKTQSAIYRVRYTGPKVEAVAPGKHVQQRNEYSATMLKLRRELEAYHGQRNIEALDKMWPHLDSPDPWIRYAARVAIEHQPEKLWLGPTSGVKLGPVGQLEALMLRVQSRFDGNIGVADMVNKISWETLPVSERLVALRTYELYLGDGEGGNKAIAARLSPLYPDREWRVNRLLSRILARVDAPDFVPKTLQLLAVAQTQQEQLHYIFVLRKAKHGWTDALRADYYRWLARLPSFLGGEGMPTFAARITADALAALDEPQRLAAEKVIAAANKPLPPPVLDRPLVKEWTLSELLPSLNDVGGKRDLKRGHEMFTSSLCIYCHRVGSEGAAVGPNLTDVARRFSRRDILLHILEPSQVVSEKYRTDVVVTFSGNVYTGRIVPSADYRQSQLTIATNPLQPDQVTSVVKQDVESHTQSPVSVMPKGLLNTLHKDEILDLLAWLEAGGRIENK